MYVERTRTMPHCSIVAFASVCRPKYDRNLVAYQLIIRLSWCEASNDVNSFLLYGQAARSAEVEMVVSSIVAVVWLARPSQYAPGGVVGKGRSSGDSDLFTPFSYQCHTSNYQSLCVGQWLRILHPAVHACCSPYIAI